MNTHGNPADSHVAFAKDRMLPKFIPKLPIGLEGVELANKKFGDSSGPGFRVKPAAVKTGV